MSEPETKEEGTTQVNVQETVVAEVNAPFTFLLALRLTTQNWVAHRQPWIFADSGPSYKHLHSAREAPC